MKVRTLRYIVREGVLNTYKNKLMSLAAISIVVASLIIFGVFLLLALNIEYNTEILRQKSELKVFCHYGLDETQVGHVEEAIKNNDKIKSYEIVRKKQAFERMKEELEEHANVLDGYDEEIFPVSFNITLYDIEYGGEVAEELKNIPGVKSVSYSKELGDFISRFTRWINLISLVLVVILLIFAISIIANTIKLTVFARSREINIMKYIGATDWFIRWPFIVEGIVIGFIGAVIAFLITRAGYIAVESRFNRDFATISLNFIKIIAVNEVQYFIALSYVLLGCVIGAGGSFITIRKYLRV